MRLGRWELTQYRPRRRRGSRQASYGYRRPRRRTKLAPWRRQAVKGGAALIAVGGLLGLLGHLWSSGWFGDQVDNGQRALVALAGGAGFAVGDVLVEGRQRTGGDDLLAALGVSRGMAIFAIDPDAARQRIEALAWVREASVARRLPDTVYVRIEEHEPLALWQQDGAVSVIDTNGAVIPAGQVAQFTDLPLVVGDGAAQRAADFLALLATYPAVAAQTEAAVLVSERRWNLRLKGAIEVKLPEDQVATALQTLTSMDKEQALFSRNLVAVDLRLPNQMILQKRPAPKERPDAAAAPRLAGKAT